MNDVSPDRAQQVVEGNTTDLLSYFLRRVDVAEDAADLLNDTLLVLWRKASDLPADDTEARMWMFGIARRVLSTHRRSTGRRSALHDKLRQHLATTIQPHHTDGLDVAGAVRLLSPDDQELIRLVFWDGFSQAEVARLLDLPEGTVRSRTHRARQRLRELLGEPPTVLHAGDPSADRRRH